MVRFKSSLHCTPHTQAQIKMIRSGVIPLKECLRYFEKLRWLGGAPFKTTGTSIKDAWTKPKGGRIEVGGGMAGVWGGAEGESGDNCTWTIKNNNKIFFKREEKSKANLLKKVHI